jgi:hypothetical protein
MTTTKIVPFHEVSLELLVVKQEQLAKNGHHPFNSPDGHIAGFISPFSVTRHVAQVQVDDDGKIVAFDFDQMERTDGRVDVNDPWGHATPNAMVVVLEWSEDGTLLVHSVKEYRPFMYDHRSDVKGMTVVGVTGKWAKSLGANPAVTALQGALTDSGIEVDESSVKLLGIHNPNRAWIETCNEVFVAIFKRKVAPVADGTHDQVSLDGVYPLGDFPIGPDALVNSALWLTAKYFGCISSRPL